MKTGPYGVKFVRCVPKEKVDDTRPETIAPNVAAWLLVVLSEVLPVEVLLVSIGI